MVGTGVPAIEEFRERDEILVVVLVIVIGRWVEAQRFRALGKRLGQILLTKFAAGSIPEEQATVRIEKKSAPISPSEELISTSTLHAPKSPQGSVARASPPTSVATAAAIAVDNALFLVMIVLPFRKIAGSFWCAFLDGSANGKRLLISYAAS